MKRGNFKHTLDEILFLAVTSAICGIVDWDEMEMFGKSQIEWFRKYFPFSHGIPSHDTIGRLFSKLSPEEFCRYFTEWAGTLRKNIDREVIAIDGKAVRGSAERSKGIKSAYFVSVYAAENQLVLSQQMVDQKSNEITAVPQLLDLIDCRGAIITVDALNCQTDIVKKVINKDADYIFAIKSNQGELYEQVVNRFENQNIDSKDTTHSVGHGRAEIRRCSVIENLTFVDNAPGWVGLRSIIKVESERCIKATSETQTEIRYYISSLSADAKLINHSIRQHWSIENKLHWMLDFSFREDASRKRKDHSTHNYGMICKIALNMIKQYNGKGTIPLQNQTIC